MNQTLFLTNSLTQKKEQFHPINNNHIKMYVCGPTVYDRPHIGNARSAVVYDILYRLLKFIYKEVTYVRNITDVDDKIIEAAKHNSEDILGLTTRMTKIYHEDIGSIFCLVPTIEPKATDHISDMINMIQKLISIEIAYKADNHILFDIKKYKSYGELSRRSIEEMMHGSRIEVATYKKNEMDFVLWKPEKQGEEFASFDSPFGRGRPGWHIECSAMSYKYLGSEFDIHGGGADLIFPHHENEIAQSKAALGTEKLARYWVHNGFLTVNGQKMSKSLGNFTTVKDLLNLGVDGNEIRYFYMTAHYRKPLDYNKKAISDSKKSIERFRQAISKLKDDANDEDVQIDQLISYLLDDLNTSELLSYLHKLSQNAIAGNFDDAILLRKCLKFLGFQIEQKTFNIPEDIISLAKQRKYLKESKNWQQADIIREKIESLGFKVIDTNDGYRIEIL